MGYYCPRGGSRDALGERTIRPCRGCTIRRGSGHCSWRTRPRVTHFVQPVAQFLAAFPANLLFPIAVSTIVALKLNPDIWLSPLMILGTQWYILFNVIAGASAIPSELRDVGTNLQIRGWLWWRKIAL